MQCLEKVLFGLLAVSLAGLLISQSLLLTRYRNDDFALVGSSDGIPLEKEVYLYGHGKIGLNLVGEEISPDLKVLVNGDQQQAFSTKYVEINVNDGDVIEIDGTNVMKDIYVDVASESGNMKQKLIGKRIRVRGNIQLVAKVIIKN